MDAQWMRKTSNLFEKGPCEAKSFARAFSMPLPPQTENPGTAKIGTETDRLRQTVKFFYFVQMRNQKQEKFLILFYSYRIDRNLNSCYTRNRTKLRFALFLERTAVGSLRLLRQKPHLRSSALCNVNGISGRTKLRFACSSKERLSARCASCGKS